MRLGYGKRENTVFNSRMQTTQIGLGNGVNSQNLLKLEYEYGATASVNNGNVTKQTITVPGVANPFVQTYAYDELNRLTNAEEMKNSVQQWEQTFTYDRFGNRNFDEANTTTLVKNCGSSPSFTVCAAAKNIGYVCIADGTWEIKYAGAGGLDIGGEFGVALQDIIDSSKVVTLSMTTAGLEDKGGAITSLSDDNNSVSIRISYNVVSTAESVLKTQGYKGTDGKDLKFTLSVAVAHELGHAWGHVRDQTGERYDQLSWYQSSRSLIKENNDRAVQLENLERQRLGLGLRWRH